MRGLQTISFLLLSTFSYFSAISAYYVPGTYPQEFSMGDPLQAHVNSLTSFETELPFDYYSMPFCKPKEGVKRIANTANPGTILMGVSIENSPYNFTMKVKQTGQLACNSEHYYGPLTKSEVENLKTKIDQHYRVNMMLDNLPVTVYDLLDEDQEFVRPGFELGYKKDGSYFVYNHLIFNILVHKTHGEYRNMNSQYNAMADVSGRRVLLQRKGGENVERQLEEDLIPGSDGSAPQTVTVDAVQTSKAGQDVLYMVVGFEVSPCSIARDPDGPIDDIVCGVENDVHIEAQEVVEGAKIVYTYDVYWQDSKIMWASRWDAYLKMPGGKVHWFSILNSSLVVLVMAGFVAGILVRTVRRDLSRYEAMIESNSADLRDEGGWKLVSGDVFRAPSSSDWLAVYFGSGVQIMATLGVIVILAALGFLSPASRGALLSATMLMFVVLSFTAGHTSVRLWGLMQRGFTGWEYVATKTALFYPGSVLLIFTALNLTIHHTGSIGAVPIGIYFSIVAVWFLISIPLTFLGGYLATKQEIASYPVKTNQIPRHIPTPPLAANPWLLFFSAGTLPFGAVFIELYFALTSVWLGFFYYLFGFVLLISILAIVITAEVAILSTYVQLCVEDYQWWWPSFHRGGSSIMYVALYAFAFMLSNATSLSGFLPMFIYLCYTSIFLFGVYLAMGMVGTLASFWFVVTIFRAVKQD